MKDWWNDPFFARERRMAAEMHNAKEIVARHDAAYRANVDELIGTIRARIEVQKTLDSIDKRIRTLLKATIERGDEIRNSGRAPKEPPMTTATTEEV